MALWEAYLASLPRVSDFGAPLRAQAKGESPQVIGVSHVIHVIEMGPGTLVRTPVPCARVTMTLASKANSLKLLIIIRQIKIITI